MSGSDNQRRAGVLLCLASAAGFGAMAILAKGAYAGGAGVVGLLAARFGLAAIALWALVAWRSRRAGGAAFPRDGAGIAAAALTARGRATARWQTPRPSVPLLADGLRSAAPGLLLGALYAVEAGAFFVSLKRIDAGLAELLLYGYPALVVLGAAVLGRERLTRRRVLTLGLATSGVALVLVGGSLGTISLVGVAAALGSSVLYAGYTLAGESLVAKTEPVLLTAQIATGAALVLTGFGLGSGQLSLHLDLAGWACLGGIVVLCTLIPVLAFLAGVQRIGSPAAAVVSTVEPFLTVSLAWVVLGERLAPLQLCGGALVVGALVVLAGPRGSLRRHGAAALLARPAAARKVLAQAA